MHHKEEMPARMKSDAKDRIAIRNKLELWIDPLHNDQHSGELINIVTGKIVAHPSVNVDNAATLGLQQMKTFEEHWPTSFHQTIHNSVNTMVIS